MHPGSPKEGLGRSLARSTWVGWPGVEGGGDDTQAWAFGEIGLCFGSSLTRHRGRHVGQGRAVSGEKAGGQGRPSVPPLRLAPRQEGWKPQHTIGR